MRAARPCDSAAALWCAIALCLPVASARAGWSPEGVTVRSTTASIPVVEGCSDGSNGTFVAWQEEASLGQGELRAQHLLATGDLDPAWPSSGALACGVLAPRWMIGLVPDHVGGVYAWWMTGNSLAVTRIDATGQIAAGWPAQGRTLGSVLSDNRYPSVIEDGAGGFYAAWMTWNPLVADPYMLMAVHLGPSNTGAGGWSSGTRAIASDLVPTIKFWPQLALAPDGGIFAAWAAMSTDSTVVPSTWRLRRLTSAGTNAAGWPGPGIDLGPFNRAAYASDAAAPMLGLCPDDSGGVYLLSVNPTIHPSFEQRLLRRQGDGQSPPAWPPNGLVVPGWFFTYYGDYGSEEPVRVLPDGQGGAIVGGPVLYDHFTNYGYLRCRGSGQFVGSSQIEGALAGHEVFRKGDGGVYLAHFSPNGPSGPYQPYAYLCIGQSVAPPEWGGWCESHPEPSTAWYEDIGLAPAGDGGAVFFWSQKRERFGLFARRFSPWGQVAGVAPVGVGTLAIRGLRFVPGEGLHASIILPEGPGRLDCFDVAGRRWATTSVEGGAGTIEITMPGTVHLPSGLYFGRLVAGRDATIARAVVTR